jgi:hypothetical protein
MAMNRPLLTLSLALCAAAPAQAALVTASFTGTVASAYDRMDNLGFNALVGQAVSATLTLDTAAAPAATAANSSMAYYRQLAPWYALAFQVGGQNYSVDGYLAPNADNDSYTAYVSNFDAPGYTDYVQFAAFHGGGVNCWNNPSAYGCTGFRGTQASLIAQLPNQLTGTDLLQLANTLTGSLGSAFYWQGDYDYDCTKRTDYWGTVTATCDNNYRSEGWLNIKLDHAAFGTPPSPVPLPGTAPLMAGGLALLAWLRRRPA